MTLEWQAKEFEERTRSVDWFWTVGIVAIGLAVIAIIFGNALFALFVIVSTAALLLQTLKKPHLGKFKLGTTGIHIDTRLYPYSTLESFFVNEDRHQVLFKSEKMLMPLIVVPLGDMNPFTVRDFLLDTLPEDELHEPITNYIMEHLGF